MIGIIGGTGLYAMEDLEVLESLEIETPFGAPSASLVRGRLAGKEVIFLPRHGTAHQHLPSEINYRANIWALKAAGVRRLVGVSAVGSLSEDVAPGDLAIPGQYLDWTRGRRAHTFFGEGLVAHVSTAEPTCPSLVKKVVQSAVRSGASIHTGKTYACVEGPRLGSRAESHFLRSAGCHLVGMTNVPEAFLAREAQLCYCTVAIATDYDCWKENSAEHASVDQMMALYHRNISKVKKVLKAWIAEENGIFECQCRESLKYAVLTSEVTLNDRQKRLLTFLRD